MYGQYQNTALFLSRRPNRTLKKPFDRSKSNRSNDQRQHSERKNQVYPFMKIFLTKRQKDIRQAIVYRYNKSKIRQYHYPNKWQIDSMSKSMTRSVRSSRSSQMKQYKQLKGKTFVNLKDYHLRQKSREPQQSSKSKLLLRIKLKSNNSRLIKTQGDQLQTHSLQKQQRGIKKQPIGTGRSFTTIQFKQQQTRSVDTKGNITSQKFLQNQATLNTKRRKLKHPGKSLVASGTPKTKNLALKQNFIKS